MAEVVPVCIKVAQTLCTHAFEVRFDVCDVCVNLGLGALCAEISGYNVGDAVHDDRHRNIPCAQFPQGIFEDGGAQRDQCELILHQRFIGHVDSVAGDNFQNCLVTKLENKLSIVFREEDFGWNEGHHRGPVVLEYFFSERCIACLLFCGRHWIC